MRFFKAFGLTKKRLVIIGPIVALMLGAGGFVFAASQEEHDSFCASCHTQPESTYYERSIAPEQVDLATAHRQKDIRCIDCHSGIGLPGRLTAEVTGAQNAFMWFTGLATQPAPLTRPLGDDHCVKCHDDILTRTYDMDVRSRLYGPKGHYHAFLTRWQAADPAAAPCTTCHSGHDLGGSHTSTWIVPAAIQATCETCHKVLGVD